MYGYMNLGHVYLIEANEVKALNCYIKSLLSFEDKNLFWQGMRDDYQYLEQYGITPEKYNSVLEEVKSQSKSKNNQQ